MEKEIGKVTHYYDKINVAVIKLDGKLKKGDKIKIKKGDEEIEEVINSMQIDHKDVDSAKKRDDVAIKLIHKTKEGAIVFLIE
ncbi:MAG: translation elongation factor-like protein [Patescibacteria group bacterium]